MTKYEFKAVACPDRARRDVAPGADAFCETLTAAINELAGDGWDYVRAETIEVRTRRFLRSRRETRTFLVFRREAVPLFVPRAAVDFGQSVAQVRARRVKSDEVVAFVRGGGRRVVAPRDNETANADMPAFRAGAPVTAAE